MVVNIDHGWADHFGVFTTIVPSNDLIGQALVDFTFTQTRRADTGGNIFIRFFFGSLLLPPTDNELRR